MKEGDDSVLPLSIATRKAFLNAIDAGYCHGRFDKYRVTPAGHCP